MSAILVLTTVGGLISRVSTGTSGVIALSVTDGDKLTVTDSSGGTGNLQVLGTGDIPIPGLYAAGSTGQGGLLLEGHGHHLGWGFTSGRIAGRHAALASQNENDLISG